MLISSRFPRIPKFPYPNPVKHGYPKPWRERLRDMTIAVGILSDHALVLCADSQEGTLVPGQFKQSVGKITFVSSGHSRDGKFHDTSICIAGAGDSGYINAFRYEVINRFSELGDDLDLNQFEAELRKMLRVFFKLHVIPFSQVLDLRVQFIIAAQSRNERRMWLTNLATLTRPQQYTAIGSGHPWALTVIPWRTYAADEQRASVVAAYAVYVAKAHAEGCGGDTSLVSIRPYGPVVAVSEALIELDKRFRAYRKEERNLIGATFGLPRIERSGQLLGCHSIADRLERLNSEIFSIDLYGDKAIESASLNPQPTIAVPSPQPPSQESPGGTDEF